jgi:hypothetical protein
MRIRSRVARTLTAVGGLCFNDMGVILARHAEELAADRSLAGSDFGKKQGWAQYSLEALRALVPVDQIIQRFAECEAEFKTERDTPLRAAKPDTGNLGATGHLPVRYFTCPIFAVSDVGPTVPPNIDGFHFIQKRKMKDYIASLPRP